MFELVWALEQIFKKLVRVTHLDLAIAIDSLRIQNLRYEAAMLAKPISVGHGGYGVPMHSVEKMWSDCAQGREYHGLAIRSRRLN